MRMIKVLHIIDHLPNYHKVWGGAEKSAIRRIKTLTKSKNFQTYVAATKPQKPVKEDFIFFNIKTVEEFFPSSWALYITGIKNQFLPFDILSFFSTLRLIKKVKPDVVHLHKTNKISFSPILACWILHVPIALSISDYWHFCPLAVLMDNNGHLCHRFHGSWCARCPGTEKYGPMRKFAFIFRRPIFDFFLGKVNAFRVSSSSNIKLLTSYGIPEEKLIVVRQAYEPQTTKIKGQIIPKTIYLNAWMAPHKGVHIAIASLAEVVKKIPEIKLCIDTKIFDLQYKKKIMKMIKKFQLEDQIEISQKPSLEIYFQHIREANIVIVPEQWENMGSTTLGDAMAMEKAIVASQIGGFPEMIKDEENGLLADPHDSADFAQKIIRLLENHSLAVKLGKQAGKDIRQLGSPIVCRQQLSKLYKTAMQLT